VYNSLRLGENPKTEKKTLFRIGSPPADPISEAEPVVPPRGRPALFLRAFAWIFFTDGNEGRLLLGWDTLIWTACDGGKAA
jgi:hypothetical protein